jgi:hypothetical protein
MGGVGILCRCLTGTVVILLITAGIADARGGGSRDSGFGGGRSAGIGSSRSGGAHGFASRSSRPVVGWGHGTCKSATCLGKHPTGTYMHPIFPKKRAQ